MIKTATKSQTFGNNRYGNLVEEDTFSPPTAEQALEAASSTNSGAFGTSFLDFLNNGVTNVFGWLGLKQQTVQNNANMSFEYSHEDQKTRRTRTIILGLVAVAVVVGAIIISKKKK